MEPCQRLEPGRKGGHPQHLEGLQLKEAHVPECKIGSVLNGTAITASAQALVGAGHRKEEKGGCV